VLNVKSALSLAQENIFSKLQTQVRNAMIYRLFACILLEQKMQEKKEGAKEEVNVDLNSKDFQESDEKIIDPGIFEKEYPALSHQLEELKVDVSGSVEVFAPKVFARMRENDSKLLNFEASLDFAKNKEAI